MSSKSTFKVKPKKVAPPLPREAKDINTEYTEFAKLLGDRTVKAEGLRKEIQDILNRIENLGGELNARLKLDAEAKANLEKTEVKDATPVATDTAS